ncbi:alpha/beta fold hydrolase [Ruegeria sp.]|uniref:alpha/beta fold hydrolase n=1 Tax=Ruegeria sp. TaxID=1879320 RepID=UPI003B0059F7
MQEQADILQRAAAQLGAEKPIVAGQSLGGSVALAWAVTRPNNLSALVLIAPAAIPWETPLDNFLTSDLFVDLTGFLVCFQVWLLRGAL